MARNPVAANVLMLILIVGGMVTLASGIKQEVFPEINMDIVLVEVVYPGASPAERPRGVRVEGPLEGGEAGPGSSRQLAGHGEGAGA